MALYIACVSNSLHNQSDAADSDSIWLSSQLPARRIPCDSRLHWISWSCQQNREDVIQIHWWRKALCISYGQKALLLIITNSLSSSSSPPPPPPQLNPFHYPHSLKPPCSITLTLTLICLGIFAAWNKDACQNLTPKHTTFSLRLRVCINKFRHNIAKFSY